MDKEIKKEIEAVIATHKEMIAEFQKSGIEVIVSAAKLITDSLKSGGRVYICGNGGSAADAQHIAGELVGRFKRERKALAAVALSTDTSVITSIANDYGYDDIFTRQVEGLVRAGDILWAISTSGNSPNVVGAAKLAKEIGAKVITFTGRPGSKLDEFSDVIFCAEAESTFHVQQIHQIGYHIICDLVEKNFTD
jgi:D-sedoheptulose 7-phosphate isomerase